MAAQRRAFLYLLLLVLVSTSCTAAQPETTIIVTEERLRAPPPGKGNLAGQVLYRCNQQPAENYCVHVFPGAEGDATATDQLRVDNFGQFELYGMDPGEYRLTAAQSCGAIRFSFAQERVTISQGETTVADDILVDLCPDVVLLEPAPAEVATTSRPTFSWQPYPGDVAYQVEVDTEDNGRHSLPGPLEATTETSLTALEDLPTGTHEWRVVVYEHGGSGALQERLGASPSRSITISVE